MVHSSSKRFETTSNHNRKTTPFPSITAALLVRGSPSFAGTVTSMETGLKKPVLAQVELLLH